MRVVRIIILILGGIVGALGLLEGTARLLASAGRGEHFAAELNADRPFVRADPDLGFSLVPGYADGLYRIDAAGFRGHPALPPPTGTTVILCVGDSTTFGWLVPEGGDFPTQLSGLLGERSATALVVNGGVPSYTSAQVLRKLARDIDVVRPAIVIVTMPWNDLWYSALEHWQPSDLLPHLPSPWVARISRHSALLRLVAGVISEPGLGVLGRRRGDAIDHSTPAALETFSDNLIEMVEILRRRNVEPVFQVPPFSAGRVPPGGLRFRATGLHWRREFVFRMAGRYAGRFRRIATEQRVTLIPNPLFMDRAGRDPRFIDEIHPTAVGYRIMARSLLGGLTAAGVLEKVSR